MPEPSADPPRTSSSGAPTAGRRFAARAVVVLCLALAAVAVLDALAWARNRDAVVELVLASGLVADDPGDLVRRLERENVPHHARLAAARSLVYLSLAHLSGSDAEAYRDAAAAALPRARELAAEVLARQPNSWQGSMLLGTATYLEWSLARDRRLYTESERWEEPLAKAVREAGAQPEPKRLLATAYLEVWNALSEAKREAARELLAQVFRDDFRAFEALVPAWLEVAGDRRRALSVVPDRPDAWRVLERTFADAGDWDDYQLAREGFLDALERHLQQRLREAEERLRLGDYYRARSLLLKILVAAPPSQRFVPIAGRALEAYPPGLHGLGSASDLRRWLDWVLDLDQVGVRPLSPRAVDRLVDALGDLDTPVAAHAAAVTADAGQIERFERLADTPELPLWTPFQVAKARWHLEGGEVERAAEDLARVGVVGRQRLSYAEVRARVARALGDAVATELAEARLDELRKRRWSVFEWRLEGRRGCLEMLPAAAGRGLAVDLAELPRRGAVLEASVDGALVRRAVTRRGAQVLRLDVPLEPRPHLLCVESVAGGAVVPGEVRLLGDG